MILASDQCAGRPSRLLRFGGEWRQNEAECEPDPPRGAPRWRMAGGSVAEDALSERL
jgi:hypothetical protein